MTKEAVRTHVVLPKDLVDELNELVGPRRRSEFIAEAAKEKLDRLKRVRAFDRVVGSLADVDIPGWETPEAAAEWVRASRRLDSERLEKILQDM
jgi:hypothetical protein